MSTTSPAGRVYSAPLNSLAGIKGAASRQGGNRKGRGKGVKRDGREGKRRVRGKGEKGKDGAGRGKVTEAMGGTGEDMGWGGREGKGGRGRKESRGATASRNFNSWRRHC